MSMSMSNTRRRRIVITGGLGNLGTKLCRHLLDNEQKNHIDYEVVLVEHPDFMNADTKSRVPCDDDAAVVLLPCDLGDIGGNNKDAINKLREALEGADAVVHFSAVNPYPNASWGESARSMDHTFNIFQLAVMCKVRRVILASSNHVMGGYKDDAAFGPSSIHPSSDPRCGTLPLNPDLVATSGDGVAYAAAKLAGERLAMSLANLHAETTTFVVLRIGWCQPGENLPSTLSAAGSPPEFLKGGAEAAVPLQSEEDKKDELWFKRMWLSNRDFLRYFDAALRLEVPVEEPKEKGDGAHRNVRRGFVLVNAMSANDGAKWNLEETVKWLGVVSEDNSLA